MRKSKGRVDQYDEAGLSEDEENFEANRVFGEDETATPRPKSRGHGPTRQRLEMRGEEQWLRKQLSDWDDDFDGSDDIGLEADRTNEE